jgi:Protein of unknown function (DUF2167)
VGPYPPLPSTPSLAPFLRLSIIPLNRVVPTSPRSATFIKRRERPAVANIEAVFGANDPDGFFVNAGKGYEDFNASTDHIAAYGLAALVGGVVAKSSGCSRSSRSSHSHSSFGPGNTTRKLRRTARITQFRRKSNWNTALYIWD